ncbi:MAG TPA: hypothetical protein VKS20_00630 [Candidatus Acidoferrales bacterium]|nr:hypothetical protein [Candidatus Acidoferrales bacterium]
MEKPLFVGRLLRIVLGIGALVYLLLNPLSIIWQIILAFIGVSMIVGGIIAHPGCEIWALPSLLFRSRAQCA